MKKIVFIAAISVQIQGCTTIPQPTASRPLVEHAFISPTALVDLSLGAALSTQKAGSALVVEQRPAVMGDRFFAAIGLTCRKLTAEKAGQHIYCLNHQGNWFKVNQVISEHHGDVMTGSGL